MSPNWKLLNFAFRSYNRFYLDAIFCSPSLLTSKLTLNYISGFPISDPDQNFPPPLRVWPSDHIAR